LNTLRGITLGVLLALAASAAAVVYEQREFADAGQLERYKTLIAELRCLVCQNQNIVDSDADLAADLRREVHRMILEGKSDEAIIDFMVTRYGDLHPSCSASAAWCCYYSSYAAATPIPRPPHPWTPKNAHA